MAELSRELKQEKQKRKEFDNKFSQIQEEITDMKSTNETLQKVGQLNYRNCDESDIFSILFLNSFFNMHKCFNNLYYIQYTGLFLPFFTCK